MTKQTCIAFAPEQLEGIDRHRNIKHIGRSGLVRIAVGEFLARESEKVEKINEKGGKKRT